MNKHHQVGFNLIEMAVVITLLAILAAIAIPRFANISASANQNSTNSLAAALAAASAENFAKKNINSSATTIANCSAISGLLPAPFPSGYTITSAAITSGTTSSCTLNGPGATTATFQGSGV